MWLINVVSGADLWEMIKEDDSVVKEDVLGKTPLYVGCALRESIQDGKMTLSVFCFRELRVICCGKNQSIS